jgi:hypothetical protein
VPFTEPGVAKVRHSDTTNGYIIAAMRVMKLLAIGGVTAAAGATISCGLRITVAYSPAAAPGAGTATAPDH